MSIVTIAETASEHLRTIDILTLQKKNADDIHATQKELQEVLIIAKQVSVLCQIMQNRLNIQDHLQKDLPKIIQETQTLRQQFVAGEKQRQVQEIRLGIAASLKRIRSRLETKWKDYADQRLKSLFDLLEIVQSLPEIRANEQAISRLVSRLRYYNSTMPATLPHLEEFDRSIAELHQILSQLENLHPDVTNFLRKVHKGIATMSDVTDEVVKWCRQGEHARSFTIQFAS